MTRGELIVISGRYRGHRIPLTRNVMRIGRDRACDVPIDDEAASRIHFEILNRDEQLLVRDLHSTNGTFVNDTRISEVPLRNGDRVAFGDTVMLLQLADVVEPVAPNIVFSKESRESGTRYSLSLSDTRFLELKEGTTISEAQRHLALLYDFMNEVAGMLHLPALLNRALDQFLKSFPADRGLILLLTPEGEPGPKVTRNRDGLEIKREITISRTMAHQLLQKKESFLTIDATSDSRLAGATSLHEMHVCSIMGVPLTVKDKVIGMCYFDTISTGQMFSETDLKLCTAMSMQLAVYIENTRLYTELLDAIEFNTSVLRSLKSGVVVLDLNGRVIRVNRAAEEILELPENTLLGRQLTEFPEYTELNKVVQNTLVSGVPEDRYEVLLKIHGQVVPLGLTTSLLLDHCGKVIGSVATFRNLAQIRRLEEQLRRSQHLAALGQMAAGVAHEIRNPLNSIRGFAQLLQENADPAANAEYTKIILEEVDRMNRIVQDLLDYSRQRELTLMPVPTEQVLEEIVRDMQPDARQAKVALQLNKPETVLPCVMGNTDKLRQVFRNIIINGIQACQPEGAVRITLSSREEPAVVAKEQNIAGAPLRKMVVVTITDDGCGIDPAILPKIFDPFFTRKDSGTGLGLSISQKIVDQHGGRIEVRSEPGKGAAFGVVLPAI